MSATTKFSVRPKITLAFSVYGKPQPAGSKRAFPIRRRDGSTGVAVSDANPNSKVWQSRVVDAARDAIDCWMDVHCSASFPLLTGALEVKFVFFVDRPKSHFGKRGLREAAPEYPTVKPDVLKLARGVEDALSKVIWSDDAQIVTETLEKRYFQDGANPGVMITIREL